MTLIPGPESESWLVLFTLRGTEISSLQGTPDMLDSCLEKEGVLVASTLIQEVGSSSLLSLKHPCCLCKCLDGQSLNRLHCFLTANSSLM